MREKLYMSAYYLAHAVYQSYISVYYRAAGLSAAEIGVLLAAVAAVSAPSQFLFGALSDKSARPLRVLRALLLFSATLLLAQASARGFAALLPLSVLFGLFYAPVQPLGDAAVLEGLRRGDRPFGPVRLMGALAFAAAALAFGPLLDLGGREKWVALGAAALLVAAWAASFLLSRGPGERKEVRPLRLLKDKKLLALLLFTLPAQTTMGYFYAFFPLRFLEMPGAGGTLLGWANVVAAAAEMPFLLLSDRLFARMGAARMVALATAALGARWALAAAARNVWLLMLSQLLHGLGYICISVAMALYVNRAVSEELRASGQALCAAFSFGLSRVLGSGLGGLAAGALGSGGGFTLCAALCALSLALFFPLWKAGLGKTPGDML